MYKQLKRDCNILNSTLIEKINNCQTKLSKVNIYQNHTFIVLFIINSFHMKCFLFHNIQNSILLIFSYQNGLKPLISTTFYSIYNYFNSYKWVNKTFVMYLI